MSVDGMETYINLNACQSNTSGDGEMEIWKEIKSEGAGHMFFIEGLRDAYQRGAYLMV